MKKLVVQDPENEVPREVLAAAIVKISGAAEALSRSGLNRTAIVVLLADRTKLGKSTIGLVLDGIAGLRRDYCR